VNGTDPLGLFTVSEVPSLIKLGVDKYIKKMPQIAFDKVLGRLLKGPTSFIDFFISPDTFASPLQEDMRYSDLFPEIYGGLGNSPDKLGLQYDPISGLYIKNRNSELRNCKGN
jgi:hypothetical protein